LRLQVGGKFCQAVHGGAEMYSSFFGCGVLCELRFDSGDPRLRSVHTRRELVSVDNTVGETVDQMFHPAAQFLALRIHRIDTFG
jgi:hypothetical protein